MKKVASVVLWLSLAGTLLGTTRSTFEVKGWTCGSCASATRIALKKLEGVTDVSTDAAKAEVVVTYDGNKVTAQRLIEAVEKLGYKASVKKKIQAGKSRDCCL